MAQSQRLREALQNCVEGDKLICTHLDSRDTYLTENMRYEVAVDGDGYLCILDDDGDLLADVSSLFVKVQPIQAPQLAPWEEATDSDDKNDKPRSIVDGDYSQYCTWDVEDPETKTSEWKPDTIREDVDIMESIRHACNRT